MSNVLRLVIVDPNDVSRESMKTMLLSLDVVWLEAECSRYEFFADVVGQTHPDLGMPGVWSFRIGWPAPQGRSRSGHGMEPTSNCV